MSQPIADVPRNPLRLMHRRVRSLDLDTQLRDCVDQLGYPEVIAGELHSAFDATRQWSAGRELPRMEAPDLDAVDIEEVATRSFYATRDVSVLGAPRSFSCLASDLDPLGDLADTREERARLDYVGLTCDATRTPVLGAVQSTEKCSAYPLLLRALASLAEMASRAQFERLNRGPFLGVLGSQPSFDLNLVLWDEPTSEVHVALEQLTRDLAERVKQAVRAHAAFPRILRDVVCLRMNRARFQGRLRLIWQV